MMDHRGGDKLYHRLVDSLAYAACNCVKSSFDCIQKLHTAFVTLTTMASIDLVATHC